MSATRGQRKTSPRKTNSIESLNAGDSYQTKAVSTKHYPRCWTGMCRLYTYFQFDSVNLFHFRPLSSLCKMFEFIVLFGLETERKEEREHCARRNLKTEVSLWKRISVHTRAKEKRQQSPVILDWCLVKITLLLSKSYVFKMLSVHNTTKSRRLRIPAQWGGRRQRGRVVRAPDVKSGGRGLKFRSDH